MRAISVTRPLTALALLAAVALLAGVLWETSAEAATTTISVTPVDSEPGDQATVSMKAQSVPVPGLGAFTVDIAFNPSVADAVSCAPAAGFFCNAGFANDKVRCGGFDPYGRTGNVALCSVTFVAVAQPPSCTALAPAVQEFVDAESVPIAHATSDGGLCVVAPPAPTATPAPKPAPTKTPVPAPTTPPTATPDSGGGGGGSPPSGGSGSGGSAPGAPAAGGSTSDESPPGVASAGDSSAPDSAEPSEDVAGETDSPADEPSADEGDAPDTDADEAAESESEDGSDFPTLLVIVLILASLAVGAVILAGYLFREQLRGMLRM